jgi:hypothetical protein
MPKRNIAVSHCLVESITKCMLCLPLSQLLGKLQHVAVFVRRPSLFSLKEAQNIPASNTIVVNFSGHHKMRNAVKPPVSH